ncbi:polysaccharide deacetylase family protein [Candidatus Dojkabacteria bacterium]|nr:polysaccharide deacetylase family protein [Candidatus Dojkabacteria bacterium]
MDPSSFQKIIAYIKKLGYHFGSLEDLRKYLTNHKMKKLCIITFDDGYKDLFYNAYPMLKKHNIPFALFLVTSTVDSSNLLWLHKLYFIIDKIIDEGKNNILEKYFGPNANLEKLLLSIRNIVRSNKYLDISRLVFSMAQEVKLSITEERRRAKQIYLSESELNDMINNGLSICVHGHNHLPLNSLSQEETEEEIKNSVKYIERHFKKKPEYYCLPYSIGNQYYINIARESGIWGVIGGNTNLIRHYEYQYNLPRIEPYDFNSFCRQICGLYIKAILRRIG